SSKLVSFPRRAWEREANPIFSPVIFRPLPEIREATMRRIAWCAALLPLLLPAAAPAANKTLELTVSAGKTDRVQTPVSVPLTLPNALAKVPLATLTLPDGKVILGQLTAPGLLADDTPAKDGEVRRELHFILPSLKAGGTVTIEADISGSVPAAPGNKSF